MGLLHWLSTGKWSPDLPAPDRFRRAVFKTLAEVPPDTRGRLVRDTDEGKLYAKIISNKEYYACADCGAPLLVGPSGGLSTNMLCSSSSCGAKFNVTPVIGIAVRM